MGFSSSTRATEPQDLPEGMVWYALKSLKACVIVPDEARNKNMEENNMNKMKHKGMALGALLTAMLLLSMVLVPSVSAQTIVQDNQIGTKEKEVISQVTEPIDYTKNLTEAEKIRKNIEQEIRKNIDQSVDNIAKDSQITAWDPVYLGTDKTFTTADYGNKGSSTWGLAPWFYGSDYYLSLNKDEAASVVGPGGYGGAGAWSWVGKTFSVYGSGSQTANIRTPGYIWGLTTAFAGGSSNSVINLVVKDITTGTAYTTNVYSQSAGGAGWFEVNQPFNNGVTVNLQAGHNYIAYLETQSSAATYGVGEAGSDFGRQDGDYSGEGAWYYSITVDF